MSESYQITPREGRIKYNSIRLKAFWLGLAALPVLVGLLRALCRLCGMVL